MEEMSGGTNDKVTVKIPLGKEERENLVARGTNVLKDERDDEVLESAVELFEDLRMNAEMREGLKSFQKHGYAFIRRTQKGMYDFKLPDTQQTSSSSMTVEELKQAKTEGNLESQLDHETHPLNNEVIMNKILEFCSVNDLKSCRLVSKKWHDLSLSCWRGRAVLQAERLFEFEESFTTTNGVRQRRVKFDEDVAENKFITNASTFLDSPVPFQRYNMKFKLLKRDEFKMKQKTIMFDLLSSSIQQLSIVCEDLNMLYLVLAKLPQLRVLNLHVNCRDWLSDYDSITSDGRDFPLRDLDLPITKLHTLGLHMISIASFPEGRVSPADFPWKKIFRSAPALKSLRFEYFGWHIAFEVIMNSLYEVRKEMNFTTLNLQELDIWEVPGNDATDNFTRRIVESKFPLQKITIHLGEGDINLSPAISRLLKAHGETLQYINFGAYQPRRMPLPFEPYFPSKVELPMSKEVVLRNDCIWAFHLLASLDAPNLEKLEISSRNYSAKGVGDAVRLILESDDFKGSYLLPNLMEFLCDATINFHVTDLQILARALPNVTSLCIHLGEDTFPLVYELWPRMESLHIVATKETYPLFDDSAITGFLVEGFDDPVQLHSEFCGPKITDLKNLRKFVMKTESDDGMNLLRPRRACITDLSAVYGFLLLPKLEILHLETVCKFSPNVMVALEEHVSEIKISEPRIFNSGLSSQR